MEGSSKKEITIAILVGLATGVIFSYGFIILKKKVTLPPSQKKGEPTKVFLSLTKKLEKKISEITQLTVDPLPESFTSKEEITISGQAPKNSVVLIITEVEEKSIELQDKESFKSVIKLIEGENQIYVASVVNGETTEIFNFTVVYQKE